eukprot:g34799.t1
MDVVALLIIARHTKVKALCAAMSNTARRNARKETGRRTKNSARRWRGGAGNETSESLVRDRARSRQDLKLKFVMTSAAIPTGAGIALRPHWHSVMNPTVQLPSHSEVLVHARVVLDRLLVSSTVSLIPQASALQPWQEFQAHLKRFLYCHCGFEHNVTNYHDRVQSIYYNSSTLHRGSHIVESGGGAEPRRAHSANFELDSVKSCVTKSLVGLSVSSSSLMAGQRVWDPRPGSTGGSAPRRPHLSSE